MKNFEKKIAPIPSDFGIHILNHSSDKIFVLDHDYRLKYFNPAAEKFSFLFEADQLELGINAIPIRDTKFWKKAFDQALAGEVLEFKKIYLIEDKKYTDLINIYPIKNAVGEITEISVQSKKLDVGSFLQKDLLDHENLFQSLFDTSPNGVIIRKFKTQELLGFNLKICELFDCTSEEFQNYDRPQFIFHENTNEIAQKMKLLEEDKLESFKIEKQYKRKNGEIFWGEATRSIFKIGDETYQIGILEDISIKKKYEEQLIKNEARVTSIFNSTTDKIFAIDKNYKLIDANHAALKVLAIHNLNKPFEEVQISDFDFSGENPWKPKLDRAFKGEEFKFEGNYIIHGENLIDLITVSPLKKISGEIIGAAIYGKEITDLQNTKQKYRNLFENVNDAIIIINKDGIMDDCNTAAQELLGYSKEELSKLYIKDIVHPCDQKRSEKYLKKLMTDGHYSNYQGRIITKDGRTKYIEVNSKAIYENGKMVGSRDIARDITQLKKDEENRTQLIAQLAEVNKELKDFAYIVSHDLKAPLRAIKNISTWLSEDYGEKIDTQGKQQLQLLINRVNRMHLFIDGIFEYTKVGRIKETKEIVAMEEIIQNANLMLNLKEDVEIKIVKKLPEIYCEKIKLEQVFQNLISNAVKYNDKHFCKIEIDYEDLVTHYLIKIKDNGKGIEKGNFERIFQIFQTLQSKDDFESTGIGLSIVKRIIQLHGGEIIVKSKLGEYTIFEFTIEKKSPSNKK